MKWLMLVVVLLSSFAGAFAASEQPRVVSEPKPLPIALNSELEFRKTKLFFLSDAPPVPTKDASINFERSYRMFGAVTALDARQRYGNYFDFFWRAKRPASVTVRLEYRQEKLRAFTQAREVSYRNVVGTQKTEFAIVGDDYFNDGRVTAWRCLLIENGRIAAITRSYLWE